MADFIISRYTIPYVVQTISYVHNIQRSCYLLIVFLQVLYDSTIDDFELKQRLEKKKLQPFFV